MNAFSNGRQQNHRGDANCDAQRGEKTSHSLAQQSLHGQLNSVID
jgi:hypothetical protein